MTTDKTPPGLRAISIARLQSMLLDPDVPDEALRPYLTLDTAESGPFEPHVRANPYAVTGPMTESAVAIASFNGVSRWRRRRRYRARLRDWDGPRIVSEGDSWFQFPFLLTDTIDHLMDDHAVLSHGAAGDLLSDILRQDELMGAVATEDAALVLLSAGGNDLLGASQLTRILEPHAPGMGAGDYLGETFERFLAATLADYGRLVTRLSEAFPSLNVVCHGYDYAVPAGGRWLGRPMQRLGIEDRAVQRAVVARMVDRFQDGIEALADTTTLRDRLFVVDARGSVGPDDWHDELHPTDEGYGRVADLFRARIDDALSRRVERPAARVETVGSGSPDAATLQDAASAALVLSAAHRPETLMREAGLRIQLADLRVAPPLDRDFTEISDGGVEGIGDGLARLGRRLLARAEDEAHELACGTKEKDTNDRAALRRSMNLGPRELALHLTTLLISKLGWPAGVAAVVTALLLDRFAPALHDEICEVWSERLGKDGGANGIEAPAIVRSVDLVSAAAKRSPGDPVRLMGMLASARPGEHRDGAPDLSASRRAASVEALRERLRTNGEAMAERAVIEPDEIDRIVETAASGLAKLGDEGERAELSLAEGLLTEAVIEADGSRPSLIVRDGRPVVGDDIGDWREAVDFFGDAIHRVAGSVGRIDVPSLPQGYGGTGFAIAPGLVLTNRHVLEAIALEDGGRDGTASSWHFPEPATIDFAREQGGDRTRRFAVTGVAFAPRDAIRYRIDFDLLDLAILRCETEGADGAFPEPLALETREDAYSQAREVYVIGYPARPRNEIGLPEDDEDAPRAGREFLRVQRTLFGDAFGIKRFSPGTLLDRPGTLQGDDRSWIANHDATTLGGSSGSCMVDLAEDGSRVMGLHFGGRSRAENWAHALAAIDDTLDGVLKVA